MLYLTAAVAVIGFLCALLCLAAFALDLYRYERDLRARRRAPACERLRIGFAETNRRSVCR